MTKYTLAIAATLYAIGAHQCLTGNSKGLALHKFTQRPPYPKQDKEGEIHPAYAVVDVWLPKPLGFDVRPALRIIRRCSLASRRYRISVFFQATPIGALRCRLKYGEFRNQQDGGLLLLRRWCILFPSRCLFRAYTVDDTAPGVNRSRP